MQSLDALSVAPDVNTWLASSRHPRILHVFDRACNLINEHREVLSIVTSEIGNGPFNLVISRLRKSPGSVFDGVSPPQSSEVFSAINIESPVSIFGDQLTLGALAINLANAKLWSPQPEWEELRAKRDNISRLLITNYQLSNPLISTLSSALVNKDISAVKDVTSRLAGLGIGLTPSGDDILLGAIYATWIIHPPEVAQALAAAIANTAAPLTTSLSVAWLRAGASGEAGELWHEFFNALLSADLSVIQFQTVKLLSIGHTSGADALAGFMGTLLSAAEAASAIHDR